MLVAVAIRDRSSSDDPQKGSKTEDAGTQANDERSRNTRIEELLSNIAQHAWRAYFERKRRRKQNPGSDC